MKIHKLSIVGILTVAYVAAGMTYYMALGNSVKAANESSVSLDESEVAVSTFADNAFEFVSDDEYVSGDKIEITAAAGATIGACSTGTTDADEDGTVDGSGTYASGTYTYTFSASTTDASDTGISICLTTGSDTAGNYAISMVTTMADESSEQYGTTLLYVGDANDVTVKAKVQNTLTFVIRNEEDNGDTNVCDLGVLSTSSVSECSYRLKVGSNSDLGYVVSLATDGDLRKSGSGDVGDTEDIDTVTDGGGVIGAGTEAYGIALVANNVSGGQAAEESATAGFNYTNDDSPLDVSGTVRALYATNYPNVPTTTSHSAVVTHRATIDVGTEAGYYEQTVTYTVTTNF